MYKPMIIERSPNMGKLTQAELERIYKDEFRLITVINSGTGYQYIFEGKVKLDG